MYESLASGGGGSNETSSGSNAAISSASYRRTGNTFIYGNNKDSSDMNSYIIYGLIAVGVYLLTKK